MPKYQYPIYLKIYNPLTLKIINRIVKNDDHFFDGSDVFVKQKCMRCYDCTKVFQTSSGEGVIFWDTLCMDPLEHVFMPTFNLFADDDSFDNFEIYRNGSFSKNGVIFEYLKGMIEKYIKNPPSFTVNLCILECKSILRAWDNMQNDDDDKIIGHPFNPFIETIFKDFIYKYSKTLSDNWGFYHDSDVREDLDKIKKNLREFLRTTVYDGKI